jgi:hypothetical protein
MIGRLVREFLARRWERRRTASHVLLGHERIQHLPMNASPLGKLGARLVIEATDKAHGELRFGAPRSTAP